MANSGDPAHYIVFHPEYKQRTVSVRATALIGCRLDHSWKGKVWVDKPPGNEDPFVLGPSWAYSYCHATQLRRQPRPDGRCVRQGSCTIFCSGDLADCGVLSVDTIFWIAQAHAWRSANQPPVRYAQDVTGRTDIWRFHLGLPGPHSGRYTYEAALHPQPEGHYSRLPLSANEGRVGVRLSQFSRDLQNLIRRGLSGQKRPVFLSSSHLAEILQFIDDETTVEVVREIMLADPVFTELRTEDSDGCGQRQPSLPRMSCSPSR